MFGVVQSWRVLMKTNEEARIIISIVEKPMDFLMKVKGIRLSKRSDI